MIPTSFNITTQPLRNLCLYPIPDASVAVQWKSEWGNGGSGTIDFIATGGPNGGPYRRMAWTTAATDTSAAVVNGVRFLTSSLKVNTRYTIVVWVRSSFSILGNATNFWFPGNTPTGGASRTPTPNQWERFVWNGLSPALSGAPTEIFLQFRGTGAIPQVGATLDVTMFEMYEGDYTGAAHQDGDTPGWQWTGTAGASESVGYPYTLESIAGTLLASVTTAGGSAPLTLGAFEGRTLYLVHDVVDTSANLMSLASIGSSISAGGGTMVIRTGSASSVYLENRPQTNNGTPIFVDAAGARTIGRHVSSATASSGAISASICVDGGTITTLALTPGTGFTPNPLLNLATVTASDVPIYAVAYRGEHDAATRTRVTAWLARQYGSIIPAGY